MFLGLCCSCSLVLDIVCSKCNHRHSNQGSHKYSTHIASDTFLEPSTLMCISTTSISSCGRSGHCTLLMSISPKMLIGKITYCGLLKLHQSCLLRWLPYWLIPSLHALSLNYDYGPIHKNKIPCETDNTHYNNIHQWPSVFICSFDLSDRLFFYSPCVTENPSHGLVPYYRKSDESKGGLAKVYMSNQIGSLWQTLTNVQEFSFKLRWLF